MNETHLYVLHSFSNRARGRRSRNSISSSVHFQSMFLFRLEPLSRDCTTFTLHDLTNLYVERMTAHCIKINDHSCLH